MRVWAAVLAAGSGTRFGGDKTALDLGGKPVWKWSVDTFQAESTISHVFLVTSRERVESFRSEHPWLDAIEGGSTRQESSQQAMKHARGNADILLIHDAARPFVRSQVISRVVEAIGRVGSAAPCVPVRDTIRRVEAAAWETLDRSQLRAMQTPQGATLALLENAHKRATVEFTDEVALLEAVGVRAELVAGDEATFKITTPMDYLAATALIGPSETRVGFGYDIHRFSVDGNRPLMLGGVRFDGLGLEGHSDADVVLHALTDALLGAVAQGDIGQHFRNTDPRWQNHDSALFVTFAVQRLAGLGWRPCNVDMTVLAERPKLMPSATAIRERIANLLGLEPEAVSIKATTHEGLGAIGRGEGIACHAVATVIRESLLIPTLRTT